MLADSPGALVKVTLFWGKEAADRQTVMIHVLGQSFRKFPLRCTASADTDDATLEITGTGNGSFHVSAVSLMPRGEDLKRSMSQYLIDQLALETGIQVETETQVVSADGTDCLKAIKTRKTGRPVIRRHADALFVMIGADAVTHWLPRQLQRENGYVRTGREVSDQPGWAADRAPFPLETNLLGFLCVGDIRYNLIKRVSSSVGEGSMAVGFRASISLVNGLPVFQSDCGHAQSSVMAIRLRPVK